MRSNSKGLKMTLTGVAALANESLDEEWDDIAKTLLEEA